MGRIVHYFIYILPLSTLLHLLANVDKPAFIAYCSKQDFHFNKPSLHILLETRSSPYCLFYFNLDSVPNIDSKSIQRNALRKR